eukprot:SRR837773.7902.p3 GENE.SRR837773.7902~~SRR837773.7902.p3  ORF type:complete len:160 (-),score=10.94 SRR837773.7902:69-548(-)
MVARTVSECCAASVAPVARKWDRKDVPGLLSGGSGLLSRLPGGLAVQLLEYLDARDMAKLATVNRALHEVSEIVCTERLRFFLGGAGPGPVGAGADDPASPDLEQLPLVRHHLSCGGLAVAVGAHRVALPRADEAHAAGAGRGAHGGGAACSRGAGAAW